MNYELTPADPYKKPQRRPIKVRILGLRKKFVYVRRVKQ